MYVFSIKGKINISTQLQYIRITRKAVSATFKYLSCPIKLSLLITLHLGNGWFMVLNATFNNISVISWQSVLLVEETGDNHRPVASH